MPNPLCEECRKTLIGRCPEHRRCDTCGSTEKLVCYVDGLWCPSCREDLINKRIAEFKGDTEFQDGAICPWCGYIQMDSWELSEGDVECPECERQYELSVERSVTYSTTKKGESGLH